MKNSIFRSILVGLLVGLLFVIATRLIIILLIMGAIYKLSGKGRWRREQWRAQRLAYANKIRSMNDDDFENFKSNVGKHHC